MNGPISPSNYRDIDVRGDGHCWYYAVLAGLFHAAMTGEIDESSQTAAALRAKDGFFDQIQRIYNAEHTPEILDLSKTTTLPETFAGILAVYGDSYDICFSDVCAPALQTVICNYATQGTKEALTQKFTDRIATRYKEWRATDPELGVGNDWNVATEAAENLSRATPEALYDMYQKDIARHAYNPEQKKDTKYKLEGGGLHNLLLEDIFNLKLEQYSAGKDLPPKDATKPTLYFRNPAGHFYAGLPCLTEAAIQNAATIATSIKYNNSTKSAKKDTASPGNNTASTFGKSATPNAVGEISASASGRFAQRFEQSLKNKTGFLQTFSAKIGYTPDKINIEKDKDAYKITTPDPSGKSELLLLRVEPTCVAAYGALLREKGTKATARALLETFKESAPGITEITITTNNDMLRQAIEQIAAEPEFGLTVVPEQSAAPGLSHSCT